MKKSNYLCMLIVPFLLSACNLFDVPSPGGGSKSSGKFIAYYNPSEEGVMGSEAGLATMTVRSGSPVYELTHSVYPPKSMYENAAIVNGRIALGLHNDFKDDISTMGTSFVMDDSDLYYLPLVAPSQDDDYSYFETNTPRVSDSGHVFYLSSTNDRSYGDQYRPHLVRYDPATDESVAAIDPKEFTISQPEKGNDTETGQIERHFCPSPDGRYVYGSIEAYGVDMGAIHWDYTIIFRYDFETESYTRIGDGHRSVTLCGLTTDGQYLLYKEYDGELHFHTYNTSTEVVSEISSYVGTVMTNASCWNERGYVEGGDASTVYVIYYHDIVSDQTIVVAELDDRPRRPQFSPDRDFIYFYLNGYEENYLCKTSGLSEGSTVDTLCAYTKDIVDFLVFK